MRLALAVAALALVYAAAGWTATGPSLRLVPGETLAVRGSGFRPGEPVRLTATTTQGPAIRRVTAGRSGAFVGRFALPADLCLVRRVTAAGARGSRAVLRLPVPACPAP